MASVTAPKVGDDQRRNAARPSVPDEDTVVRGGMARYEMFRYVAVQVTRKIGGGMSPLLTTVTLTKVQRLEALVLAAIADRRIQPDEHRDIIAGLSDLEGTARHADNRQRYGQAVLRDSHDVIYLDTMAARAGCDSPEAA